MTTNFTAKQAYAIATRFTHLTNNDPKLLFIEQENGLYHMIIHAAFLYYEFYIDAATGSILGVSTEPAAENDCTVASCAA